MYLSSSRARRAEASQGKVPVSSRICCLHQRADSPSAHHHHHHHHHNNNNNNNKKKNNNKNNNTDTKTNTMHATSLQCAKHPWNAQWMKQPLQCGEQPCAAKHPTYDEQFWQQNAWNAHQSLWRNCGMRKTHRNTATHRSKKHETLFIVHGRSEHDIAWFEHDLSMKPLQSKNSCTGHEKCDSKFWHKTKRMKGCWYSADNPSMIRPRFENELINRNPPPCRANFSSFGDAFCAETCGISCSGYLAKKYFGARPPRWSS